MPNELKKNQHFWHLVTATTFGALMIVGLLYLQKINKLEVNISVFDFFILTLATFRITRLIVHDLVMDFVRDQFADAKSGIGLSMHDLLDCPWCTGTWVALFLGFLYFATPLAWPFLLIMAISGFGTLITILASMMMIDLEKYDKKNPPTK